MMSEINPYEAPRAPIETRSAQGETSSKDIDEPRVASGQKLVVYACLLYIVAGVLGLKASLLVLPALAMALIGVVRVMRGLGWAPVARVATFVMMFVPIANLIALLIVNSRATKALRGAGYRVGFLGASKVASHMTRE